MAATLSRRIAVAVLTAGTLLGVAGAVSHAAAATQHSGRHVVAMERVYHRG